MLIDRYLTSTKNLRPIFNKIVEGTAPTRFNREHLASIGFAGSNDRAVIPLLKDLGFLAGDGVPTSRYLDYRDKSKSRAVLGRALLDVYGDLFTINENPSEKDREAIEGKFRSSQNATPRVAKEKAATFYALLGLADIKAARGGESELPPDESNSDEQTDTQPLPRDPLPRPSAIGLRYNIEVHLPPSKDVEVYNAIFKALREHLLVD